MELDSVILETAAEEVYSRDEVRGEVEDSFQSIAHFWNAYFLSRGVPDPNITSYDVAMLLLLMKVGRECEGQHEADNLIDIVGYAENAARIRSE